MKLHLKVALIVFAVFGLLFFVISKVLTRIESDNFQRLETQTITENINRVQAAVTGRADDLAVQLTNWSQWDETYNFVQDGNQEFIDQNFNEETFNQLHLNFILLKNDAGEIMFKKYLTKDKFEIDFPKGLEQIFQNLKIPTIPQGETQAKMSGIVDSTDGPYVVALQSVTTSIRNEPAKGYIVFGYAIDGDYSTALSKATYLNMDYATYKDSVQQADFIQAKQNLSLDNYTYIEKNPNKDFINGFVLIPDIFNNPAVIFRAHIHRDINIVGMDNIKRLNTLLVSIEILQIIAVLLLFEYFVLRKIGNLVRGVQIIGSKNDDDSRLQIKGHDEFSQLSLEINKMLDSLSIIKLEKKESEMRFMDIADMAPVMIWVSDFQNKIIYVNKKMKDFFGKSENDFFGGEWAKAIHPEDAKTVTEAYKNSIEKKEPISINYRIKNSNNMYSKIHMQAAVRLSTRGFFNGYNCIAFDITDFEDFDLKEKNYLAEITRINALLIENELKMVALKNKTIKK